MFEINKINKTFKIIIKSGTLSLAARPVVFFWGVKKDWTRAATMLDETPGMNYDLRQVPSSPRLTSYYTATTSLAILALMEWRSSATG